MWGRKAFVNDTSGAVALVAGVLLPLILASASFALSFVDAHNVRSKSQDALDAAVLAGASAPNSMATEQIIALADQVFAENRTQRMADKALVSVISRASAKFDVSETKVVGAISFDIESPFLRVMGINSLKIGVESGALRAISAPVCVLGLDHTQAETIDVSGRADVFLENCAAMANSSNGAGINQIGRSRLTAQDIGVNGGYRGANLFPAPTTGVGRIPDPLASVPAPLPEACHPDSGATFRQQTRTLSPGTYCGGIRVGSGGVVTLQPGIYIMQDGPLRIDSQGSVSGDEVMIAFQGPNATLEIYSGGSLDVTSPSEGIYANIQFFGDRRTYVHNQNAQSIPSGQDGGHLWFTVVGDSKLTYDGIIYMPMHHIWFAGGSVVEGSSPSYAAIAKKLWFQDNTRVHLIKENKRNIDVEGPEVLMKSARIFR